MQDYVEVSLGNNAYKLDREYKIIARTERFSKEEFEKLRQANSESNYWRDKYSEAIESLDGKFFVLCSSSELEGIDLVFERKRDESGDEVYCLTEGNRKVIFG